MKALFIIFFFFVSDKLYSQKPVNGTYTYKVAFAEWNGKSLGATCTIKIQGDSIWVIHNGDNGLTGKKDEIIDSGILVKHKTGRWIIAHSAKDKYANEIGGCTDGPMVIDIKRKKLWLC